MKTILYTNPTFTPAAAGAGTLNFSSVPNFLINRLVAVINQTQNVIIYATTAPNLGYTSFGSGILTLQANTTGYSSSDSLICIYDYDGIVSFVHDETATPTVAPVVVKNSKAVLFGVNFTPVRIDNGVGCYSAYLKIYNTNSPAVGTTVPILTICLVDANGNTPASYKIPANGIVLSGGLSYVITANSPYTDTTVPQGGHTITINYI